MQKKLTGIRSKNKDESKEKPNSFTAEEFNIEHLK